MYFPRIILSALVRKNKLYNNYFLCISLSVLTINKSWLVYTFQAIELYKFTIEIKLL